MFQCYSCNTTDFISSIMVPHDECSNHDKVAPDHAGFQQAGPSSSASSWKSSPFKGAHLPLLSEGSSWHNGCPGQQSWWKSWRREWRLQLSGQNQDSTDHREREWSSAFQVGGTPRFTKHSPHNPGILAFKKQLLHLRFSQIEGLSASLESSQCTWQ